MFGVTMDVRDWCQDLRKRKNIRVLCNDWVALQVEINKLVEAHEHQLFLRDQAAAYAQAQLKQLEEAQHDIVDQDVEKALQDEGRLKAALQVEDA